MNIMVVVSLNMFYFYQGIAGDNYPCKDHNLFAPDPSNILLIFPIGADSSHMEGLARTSPNINWTTHGIARTNPL
jgi:hypothetical protein